MAANNLPIPSTKPSSIMPATGGIISPGAMDGPEGVPIDLTIPPDLVEPLEALLGTLDPSDPLQQLLPMLEAAKAPPEEEVDPLAGLGEKMDFMRGPA